MTLNGGSDTGQGTVGINPALLQSMIGDLEGKTNGLRNAGNTLREGFNSCGLDASRVQDIFSIAQWAQEQLPLLKRRQSIAQQLYNERAAYGHLSPMVNTEWPGLFKTPEEARQEAQRLAGKIATKEGLSEEDWANLKKYQLDPDFAEEFFRKLSPEDAARWADSLRSKDKTDQERFATIANLMAVGSHRMKFDDQWLDRFYVFTPQMHRHLIGELLQHGTWDKETLKRIGAKAINRDQLGGGAQSTALILKGIARNPIAASEFYNEHFDRINAMSRGWWPGWEVDHSNLGEGLGTLVKAATVDARGAYERMRPLDNKEWTNPAEELTRRLLYDVKDHPDQPVKFEGVREAYANIVMAYYDDLRGSLTSMVPEYFDQSDPHRAGVEASAGAWTAFTQQALESPKVATALEVFFSVKYRMHSEAINPIPGAENATSLFDWQNGRMAGWLQGQLQQIKDRKDDRDTRETDALIDAIAAAGAGAVTGSAGGPWWAAAGAFVGLVQELGKAEAKDAVKSHRGQGTQRFDEKDWGEAPLERRNKAKEQFDDSNIHEIKDKHGNMWGKPPKYYEDKYGGKFTWPDPKTGKTTIMPVSEMSPEGKRAYSDWLQDPAVQVAMQARSGPDEAGRESGSKPGK